MSDRILSSLVAKTYGEQWDMFPALAPYSGSHLFAAIDKIGVWLKQQADRAGKGDLVDMNQNWTKAFQSIVRNQLNKSGKHRNDPDLVEDVMYEVMPKINSAFIGNFDKEKFPGITFESYVMRRVQQRTVDYLRQDYERNRRVELPPSDDGDGGNEDVDVFKQPNTTRPEDIMSDQVFDEAELTRDITKWLSKTKRADWYMKIWPMMMDGHSGVDMAKELNVSPTIINRYVKGIAEELKAFAEATDNDELMRALLSRTTKRHWGHVDAAVDLSNRLHKYFASMRDVAKIRQAKLIKVHHKDDVLSSDTMGSFIQSQFMADSEIEARVSTFCKQVAEADDIIETDDGQLAFLFGKED